MTLLLHAIGEALASIRRQRRRLLPMMLGIVWGMASVMVLLALAGGFEESQRQGLMAYGDRFLLVRLNRAELDRAMGGEERRLMMDTIDIERLREGAPAIRRLSPLNTSYRARITGRSGAGERARISGVLPELREIRSLPLEEGRFIDELDEETRRRVIVIGSRLRAQLFGSGPAVGETVRIAGFSTSFVPQRPQPPPAYDASRLGASGSAGRQPSAADDSDEYSITGELFEVIGVLRDVEVRSESYVSTARDGFIPFSTSCAVLDREFNTIYLEPRSIEATDLALYQFRQVMGHRYGFEPDDENAVLIYFDAVGRARAIEAVFGGLRVFLSAVGVLILGIGAIGVMNVVLASLAARRFEIGLRKALGATPFLISLQFFAETAISCLSSGGLGFILGVAAIVLLGEAPLPQGFSTPVLDARVALTSFGLLSAMAVISGLYPARRAAALPPVVALQGRG